METRNQHHITQVSKKSTLSLTFTLCLGIQHLVVKDCGLF